MDSRQTKPRLIAEQEAGRRRPHQTDPADPSPNIGDFNQSDRELLNRSRQAVLVHTNLRITYANPSFAKPSRMARPQG